MLSCYQYWEASRSFLYINKDWSIFDTILLHLMWKRLICSGTLLNVCRWKRHCLWLFFPKTFDMYIYSQYNLETSCKFLSGEWYFHLYWTLEILNSESWQEWTAPSSMLKCLFELRGRALITADNRVLILDRSIQVVMYKLRSFCMDNTSKDHSIYRWEGDCCIILCDTSELKSLRNARTVTIIWCDGQTPVHVIRMPSTESQFMHNDNVMDSMQY